ncbi:MAG: hypothetical protein HQ472_07715 [Ignavibacteria bacterium]|nr:hypothetical protein [Ignavibacteria bacterium]
MKKKRSKLRIVLRWKFIVLSLISAVFLFYIIRAFVLEAELSVGFQYLPGFSISSQVIRKETYQPPPNLTLNSRQIHTFLRISEGLDSLHRDAASGASVRKEIVNVLNWHAMSLSEYRWIRATIVNLLEIRKRRLRSYSTADSLNLAGIAQVEDRLMNCYAMLETRYDNEALEEK